MDTIGQDCVAMSVNDILVLLRYTSILPSTTLQWGKLDPLLKVADIVRVAEAVKSLAVLSLLGWRNC